MRLSLYVHAADEDDPGMSGVVAELLQANE